MSETTLQIPSSVTFEEAIHLTQELLEQIPLKQLTEEQIYTLVKDLVNNLNGARGFFVVYLTDEYSLDPSVYRAVISALKTSPEILSQLLTKNLAMSTAMAITHTRNNDLQMAQQSKNVQQRTAQLIEDLQLPNLFEELKKLHQTIENQEGSYQSFLDKWKYDAEQRQAIHQIVSKTIEGNPNENFASSS
ncbi:conserved hypothetical protein [Gloeothece citriformis PCC 7424]|uniref:Uncharacterized protein n=1 Tax=Gloeothece citriformis (strain PCC 7424) TaxID=65393 RepID=B7KFU2_GLOC7|nr:hypothetical protein [Gloeothece citriformis]ACK69135.1 conserved hypothetical protein [Gloeothece citriformis PCC 7424]